LLIYFGIGLWPLNCNNIKKEPVKPEPPRTITESRTVTESIVITEQEAVKIATTDAGGFLGTWVDAQLKKDHWHIKAFSKSVNPPVYYVVDAQTGNILLKLKNTDDPEQKQALLEFISKE